MLSKYSIDVLREVKAAILREPELYDQGTTPFRTDCGTPCCIAGWAAWVSLAPNPQQYNLLVNGNKNGRRLLMDAADITSDQADKLFQVYTNDGRFDDMGDRPGTREAAIACGMRIDHFIETGGEE